MPSATPPDPQGTPDTLRNTSRTEWDEDPDVGVFKIVDRQSQAVSLDIPDYM